MPLLVVGLLSGHDSLRIDIRVGIQSMMHLVQMGLLKRLTPLHFLKARQCDSRNRELTNLNIFTPAQELALFGCNLFVIGLVRAKCLVQNIVHRFAAL